MTGIDITISEFLNNLTGKMFFVDGVFIFSSEYLIYILTGIFIFYLLRIKEWKERMRVFALGLISVILSRGIITPIIRYFFVRQRPFVSLDLNQLVDHSQSGSFPSGHVAFIVPLAITLLYINKRAGVLALIGAFLMGIARVSVGVHWSTDILGGFVVGTVAYFISQALLKIKKPQAKEGASPQEKS